MARVAVKRGAAFVAICLLLLLACYVVMALLEDQSDLSISTGIRSINGVAFSPDGKNVSAAGFIIASFPDGKTVQNAFIKTYDVASGQEIRSFRTDRTANQLGS